MVAFWIHYLRYYAVLEHSSPGKIQNDPPLIAKEFKCINATLSENGL